MLETIKTRTFGCSCTNIAVVWGGVIKWMASSHHSFTNSAITTTTVAAADVGGGGGATNVPTTADIARALGPGPGHWVTFHTEAGADS